jgi:hypothetical protein
MFNKPSSAQQSVTKFIPNKVFCSVKTTAAAKLLFNKVTSAFVDAGTLNCPNRLIKLLSFKANPEFPFPVI